MQLSNFASSCLLRLLFGVPYAFKGLRLLSNLFRLFLSQLSLLTTCKGWGHWSILHFHSSPLLRYLHLCIITLHRFRGNFGCCLRSFLFNGLLHLATPSSCS